MAASLKNSAISGAKWNATLNFGRYFISFFLSIILARMLEPSEFGLLGMLTILTSVAMVFINSGLSIAIIRTKDTTPEDYTTVFYFNIMVSTCFYILFFFLAPIIANFYDEPKLIPLTRVITLVFFLNSFGLIQYAIMMKEMNFKRQALCSLSGLAVAAVISGIMAFTGFGVYSIVGQAISQAFVTNLMLWITSKWRPSGGFRKSSFLKLWSFGSKILATNIIEQLVNNIDNILIGKVFSANQLGFYVRAKSSRQLPQQIFTGILQTTSFPVLTKVSDNDSEFSRLHMQFFRLSAYIYVPVIFGFIGIAKAFMVLLYSEKWLPSVPIFQIIALTSIYYFLTALFAQTIMAKGKGGLYFKLNTTKKLLGLASIPFGIFLGLYPFMWALVTISFINLILDFYFTGKLVKVSVLTYLKSLFIPFLFSSIMFIGVYLIGKLEIQSNLIMMLIQCVTGILIYIILSFVFNIKEFHYLKKIVLEQLKPYFDKVKKFVKYKKLKNENSN